MTNDLEALPSIPLGRYRHYKGGEYEVLGVVRHSESLEPLVLYRPLYNNSGSWVRPFAMFLEPVEHNGKTEPRFSLVTAGASAREEDLPATVPQMEAKLATVHSAPGPQFRYEVHDGLPAEPTAIVEKGLDEFNEQAAPLHEVQAISCFVHDETGRIVGGAIGRYWGALCELQQLWVEAGHRGSGLGNQLVRAFERHAAEKGCKSFYLETLSFQAPEFYKKLGYQVAFVRSNYPHGISKYYMVKEVGGAEAAA